MIIPNPKKGYLVDASDVKSAVMSAHLWQQQANQVTEESSESELDEAFIDWGVAQGCINILKKLQTISKEDYEYLSRQQKIIQERLKLLDKKRRGVVV